MQCLPPPQPKAGQWLVWLLGSRELLANVKWSQICNPLLNEQPVAQLVSHNYTEALHNSTDHGAKNETVTTTSGFLEDLHV